MTTAGHRAVARIPAEMAELMDTMIETSPMIESESALIRHGIRLAMAEACEHKMILNPTVEMQIRQFLDKSAITIGEPLGSS